MYTIKMGCGIAISKRRLKLQEDTRPQFSFAFCKNLPKNFKTFTRSTQNLTVIFEVKSQLEISSILE